LSVSTTAGTGAAFISERAPPASAPPRASGGLGLGLRDDAGVDAGGVRAAGGRVSIVPSRRFVASCGAARSLPIAGARRFGLRFFLREPRFPARAPDVRARRRRFFLRSSLGLGASRFRLLRRALLLLDLRLEIADLRPRLRVPLRDSLAADADRGEQHASDNPRRHGPRRRGA
jgi:hypothetical protein